MHFNTERTSLPSRVNFTGRAAGAGLLPFLSLCLTLASLGCAANQAAAKPSATAPPVTLTAQDSGKSIEASVGQTILVQLDSNPTTGYQWSVQGNPAPLKFVESHYNADPQGKDRTGAGGVQTVKLTAKSAGTAQLKLEYRRPWEKDVPPAKTYAVTIVVK